MFEFNGFKVKYLTCPILESKHLRTKHLTCAIAQKWTLHLEDTLPSHASKCEEIPNLYTKFCVLAMVLSGVGLHLPIQSVCNSICWNQRQTTTDLKHIKIFPRTQSVICFINFQIHISYPLRVSIFFSFSGYFGMMLVLLLLN